MAVPLHPTHGKRAQQAIRKFTRPRSGASEGRSRRRARLVENRNARRRSFRWQCYILGRPIGSTRASNSPRRNDEGDENFICFGTYSRTCDSRLTRNRKNKI